MSCRVFQVLSAVLFCGCLMVSVARAEDAAAGQTEEKKPEAKKEAGERKEKGPREKGEFLKNVLREAFGIEMILKNSDELKLTDEQKKSLKELEEKYEKAREALKEDAKFKELLAKLGEARKGGKEGDQKAVMKELREYAQSKIAGDGETPAGAVKKILTPEQIAKVVELRKNGRGEGKEKREGREKRREKREGKDEAKTEEGGPPSALF